MARITCGKGTDFRQGIAGGKKALVSPALGHSPVEHTLGQLWKPLLLCYAEVVVGFGRIGLEGHLTSSTDRHGVTVGSAGVVSRGSRTPWLKVPKQCCCRF